MKTQMRFQKILMIVTVIIGALGAVYGLIFCSGSFAQIQWIKAGSQALTDCVNTVQSTTDVLFAVGIAFVVISVLPIIAACQKRRNYYITNYIAIGIVVAFQLAYIIIVIICISNCVSAFDKIDFAAAKDLYTDMTFNSQYGELSATPWTPIFGYVFIGLIAVDMVALVLNLVWKIFLMKGEKKLLEQGKDNTSENGEVIAEVV
ncbi:MAG: hypothetical protein NC033_00125 [Clostridiales bacterium]|nr:hypothetical protein [Clostridiales bacterium]